MNLTDLMRSQASDVDGSFSQRMRARRFEQFERFTARLPRPLRIIDLGGTNAYWASRGWGDRPGVHITLVNLDEVEQRFENIVPTVGDAMCVDAPDMSFDLAFSNSVIEHLFTRENQARMAGEIQRLAPAWWVQTPNFWFPVEPHFMIPAWQWLPERARVAILQRRDVGPWAGRTPDRDQAEKVIREHRLMRRRELEELFPGAELVPERFGGLVKSWTAVHV